MKISAIVHMYPPRHLAGAELMLHTILRTAAHLGHETCVAVREPPSAREFQGVRITGIGEQIGHLVERSDVVITHLDETRTAMIACATHHRPLVHLVHNHAQLSHNGVSPKTCALAVFNSYALAGLVHWPGEKMVLHPPVVARDYVSDLDPPDRAMGAGAITLVNMSYEKGADRFYDMARGMPDRPFFAVAGSYGHQVIHKLPNVIHLDNTLDMAEVYRMTRVVVMPSTYESYGRVAVEACANGIPVVASQTPGLLEALDEAGIFVDRERPLDWIRQVTMLDDPDYYRERSDLARMRSDVLDRERVESVRLFLRRLEDVCQTRRTPVESGST